MRSNLNTSKIRTIKLTGYVGKTLTASIDVEDSARDPEDLSGGTAYGFIYDEDESYILNLAPTGSAQGEFVIDTLITSSITPGWYRWEGGIIDSAGAQEPLFRGAVHLRTY